MNTWFSLWPKQKEPLNGTQLVIGSVLKFPCSFQKLCNLMVSFPTLKSKILIEKHMQFTAMDVLNCPKHDILIGNMMINQRMSCVIFCKQAHSKKWRQHWEFIINYADMYVVCFPNTEELSSLWPCNQDFVGLKPMCFGFQIFRESWIIMWVCLKIGHTSKNRQFDRVSSNSMGKLMKIVMTNHQI